MQRLHLKISGRVQGVFFRARTQEIAKNLGLTGWVKNTLHGKVEIVAEGDKKSLEEFLNFCRKGPQAAHVENVEVEWICASGEFSEFDIRY